MTLISVIIIASIVGAIFFTLGLYAGFYYAHNKYKKITVRIEKPSYITDSDMNRVFCDHVYTAIIKEGQISHHDDGEYKTKKVTFYIYEDEQ